MQIYLIEINRVQFLVDFIKTCSWTVNRTQVKSQLVLKEETVHCVKWTMSTTLKGLNKRNKGGTGVGRWLQRIGAVSFSYHSNTLGYTLPYTRPSCCQLSAEEGVAGDSSYCAPVPRWPFYNALALFTAIGVLRWHPLAGQMWHLAGRHPAGWAGRGVMTAANSAGLRAVSLGYCHTWPLTTWPHLLLSFIAGPLVMDLPALLCHLVGEADDR